eukprot:7390749-Prymnesium_polylepis.1
MYWAPGSGIYYDVGRTAVLQGYDYVLQRTANSSQPRWSTGGAERVELWRAGFDSVQYTHQVEDCMFKYEIVDLRRPPMGAPVGACPARDIAPHFSRGWGGGVRCDCVGDGPAGAAPSLPRGQRRDCLNCGAATLDSGAMQSPRGVELIFRERRGRDGEPAGRESQGKSNTLSCETHRRAFPSGRHGNVLYLLQTLANLCEPVANPSRTC